MKHVAIMALATAATLGASELFARWAVEAHAAVALLSPQGLDDPWALLAAAGYAGTRLLGAAMVCATAGLAAARAARRLLERR